MIVDERLKRGLSQNQLAKLAGVPQSVLCDIESGKTKSPRVDTLRAIASALGMTVSELIGDVKST
jgi:transcriptional regulator with XRE-family HTH domain